MGLGTFIQFTAGTKAVATQVNDNFDAITTWANGNVTSENLGVLNNTLQFGLNTNVNGITIANSGNVASLLITQSDNLAVGEGIITIDDSTIDQTAANAAEFRIKAKPASTIPAIWVTHGAVDTFKLTRTALNVSSAVTTTLGGPLVLSNPAVTGPINLSGNLTVTGKETINRTSTNQFLELANTTTSKSLTVTPETSSFDLNINDVASAYNFKINGVTKARIDNTGIDANYLSPGTITASALAAASLTNDAVSTNPTYTFAIPNVPPGSNWLINQTTTIYTKTFSGVAGRPVIFSVFKDANNAPDISFYWRIQIIAGGLSSIIFGGFGGPGPQIQSWISVKFNGVEISRQQYYAYPNGNYGTALDNTFNCKPFSIILLPSVTGSQTVTIDMTNYGMIYGNGTVQWTGALLDSTVQVLNF